MNTMQDHQNSEAGHQEFALSVLVTCYNSEQHLRETLDAIASQEINTPWELLLVDNMSTDSSVSIAQSYQDRVPALQILSATSGQGTPFAANHGVAHARGRSVVFCDSDDVPHPGWLQAMADALEQHEFVACRMDINSLNPTGILGERPTPQTSGLMKISYPPYLYHAGGSTLGFRRDLYLQLGGYDPEFVYLHETDFCFRMQQAGHSLHFVADAVIAVRFRRDRRSTWLQTCRWGEYNVLLAKKYRHTAAPRNRRWHRLWRELRKLLRYLLRWKRLDEGEKMRVIWLAGWFCGKIRGMVRYRSGPY